MIYFIIITKFIMTSLLRRQFTEGRYKNLLT